MPCAPPAYHNTPYVGAADYSLAPMLTAAGYSLAPMLAAAGYSLAPMLAAAGYSLVNFSPRSCMCDDFMFGYPVVGPPSASPTPYQPCLRVAGGAAGAPYIRK